MGSNPTTPTTFFTDLLRSPNEVTGRVAAGDVILRRRDAEDLVLTLPRRCACLLRDARRGSLGPVQPQGPLHGALEIRSIGAHAYTRWQYEATGDARVWYCPDAERYIVWVTEVHLGAPSRTH